MTDLATLSARVLPAVLAAGGATRVRPRRAGHAPMPGPARPRRRARPADEARATNVLLVPGTPPLLRSGAIDERPDPGSARPRVLAVLGPGATPTGLGRYLLSVLQAMPLPAEIPLLPLSLSRAVLALNPDLDARGVDWQTGRVLQLPVEVAADAAWETDAAAVERIAATLPAAAVGILDRPAAALPQPDPLALATRIGTATEATSADLATALRRNPGSAVLGLLQVLRVRREPALAAAVAGGLTDRQLSTLAGITAGSAALRALWSVTAPDSGHAEQTARLAAAVGLASAQTGPLAVGPVTAHEEPPLTAAQRSTPSGGTATVHVLGHEVQVSRVRYSYAAGRPRRTPPDAPPPPPDPVKPSRWTGWARLGTVDPAAWITARPDLVGVPPQPRQAARVEICRRIAPNEGRMDAINTYDRGLVSLGMMQWAIHVDTELAVLLARWADADPLDADALVGLYGLAVSVATTQPDGEPRTAHVRSIASGQLPVDLPASTATDIGPRQPFFGPLTTTAGADGVPEYVTAPLWAARMRFAALASASLRDEEVRYAAHRFSRMTFEIGADPVAVAGSSWTLPQLMTSRYAAALALDAYVNLPAYVVPDLRAAARRIVQEDPALVPAGPDGLPSAPFLQAFWDRYREGRRIDRQTKQRRDGHIATEFAAAADRAPGSFDAW